jgi:co-chaperonin GroES (HSP10)
MTVKAVIHRLVVKPVKLEEYDEVRAKAKELGFHIPDIEENKYHKTQIDQGTVLDIGPTAFRDYVQKYNLEIPVKVGTLITYARHSGKLVKDGDEEVVILNDDDVICIHSETKE